MFGDMDKMARMFQDEILHLKQQLKNTRFTGESSDGKVVITVNGLEEIVGVNFYVEELDPQIKNLLEHSTVEATNKVLAKVKDHLKEKFSNTGVFGGDIIGGK